MKILCVDDSRMSRGLLHQVVSGLGYEFLEAASGQDAMHCLLNEYEEISLVLLDWNIPKPDGFEVLKWIKGNDQFRHIPVVMVTAMAHEERMRTAVQAGANDYFIKPFDPEILAGRIRELVEG
jgi:two-component system, chemotaxis family, chemotaxis protein CheY